MSLYAVKSDDELFEDAIEAEAGASENRWRAADDYVELKARGYEQKAIAERVHKSPAHISFCVKAATVYPGKSERPDFQEAYEEAKGGAHVGQNTGDNEWYTPVEYIAAAVAVMGGIDLDPASTFEANSVVGAAQFFTEEQNGLEQDWQGRVWMNPPYARPLIDGFCGKLAETYSAGDVTAAVVLVNNATETGWFHALAEVAAAMCFPRHRVKFWHPRKESVPLQGQAVVYLGPDASAFRSVFVQFGFTVTL